MSSLPSSIGHVSPRDVTRAFERLRRSAPHGSPDVVFRLKSPEGGPGLTIRAGDLDAKVRRDLASLSKAADQFEATMTKQLLETMDKAMPKSETSGPMGDMAKGFLNQAVAESVSGNGRGMGLAEDLFRQLAKVMLSQEAGRQLKTAPPTASTPVPATESTGKVNP